MSARARNIAASLLCLVTTTAAAGGFGINVNQLQEISPRPGTVIAKDNLSKYRHLIDHDFAKFIDAETIHLETGAPLSFDPHLAYIHATQQYRGQSKIGAAPGQLDGYRLGRPFPEEPDIKDPQAGIKVAWNMRLAYSGDSGLIPEIHWQLRDWRRNSVEVEMNFSAKAMRFMYRHVQEPTPFIAENPTDSFGAFYMEAIEAGSYSGAQVLVYYNRDETQPRNGWVYIPQLQRTQSLASFSRNETMFGSEILPDDFLIYSGGLADVTWRYLGRTYMLLPMYRHDEATPSQRNSEDYRYHHVDFHGRAGCFPNVSWQLRSTFILQATSNDPKAPSAKRLFYVDAQTYLPMLWKIYKEGDALWKFAITAYANPDSHVAVNHESGVPIPTAFATIDIGSNRCTTVQLLAMANVEGVRAKDFDAANIKRGRRIR
ncbi:MAG: DUF1329 domain-containing protein [Pseudomonadota bacterium]